MEAIGTLAGGIAHDFNNVLSVILGYAELAKTHIDNPQKVTNDINSIITGAKKAADLVNQILTIGRKTKFEMRPLKLSLIIRETLKLLRSTLPSTIEIVEDLSSNAFILANSTNIHQVIMNLCTNAFHAMGDAGGTLAITLSQIKLDDYQIPDLNIPKGDYLKLTIKDSGGGIEPHILNKIFEPYFSTKEPGKGTGLGLAVVSGIIKEHKGYIKVESQKSEGASFHIFFPVYTKEDTHFVETSTSQSIVKGSGTILLVDDENEIVNVMTAHLERGIRGDFSYQPSTSIRGFQGKPRQL